MSSMLICFLYLISYLFNENGMRLKRPVCPPASKLDTCKSRGDMKHKKPKQKDVQEKDVSIDVQPAVGDAEERKADDSNSSNSRAKNNNNNSNAVMASLCAILFCVLCQFMI